MNIAHSAATRSEDPSHKVGCVALREDNSVAAVSYNGAPPGVSIDWNNQVEKLKKVIHAETNCLRYVHPREVKMLVCTLSPCCACLTNIAAYGITKVVYDEAYKDIEDAKRIASEYGISLEQYETILAEAYKPTRAGENL